MEKLLNLLQEFYGENRKFSNDDGLLTMTNGVENLSGAYAQTYIISLKGGFIKWLVENEKVEWDNKDIAIKEGILGKSIDNYHSLLMALSIQDEPIEFLIGLLKNV